MDRRSGHCVVVGTAATELLVKCWSGGDGGEARDRMGSSFTTVGGSRPGEPGRVVCRRDAAGVVCQSEEMRNRINWSVSLD